MVHASNHEYASRFSDLRYRWITMGREPIAACTVGITACREGGDEDPSAIVSAVAAGCNVLDTAAHYHQGAHERCVGEALACIESRGICEREALIVNTTIGPVPELIVNNIRTHGFARLKALIEERFIDPGIFGWSDLVASRQTIAPGYIRHSVEQSLARLGTDYIDVVFLDSLEIHRRHLSPTEYARRLRAAFEALEELYDRGLIRSYGISSAVPVDLGQCMSVAAAIRSTPHLHALRAPFSLLQPAMASSIEEAAALGLYVFASSCLDGGTPQYQFPPELDAEVGDQPDAAAAIQWVKSAPGVGTMLFGSRDPRHIRANLVAARLPSLAPDLYRQHEGKLT